MTEQYKPVCELIFDGAYILIAPQAKFSKAEISAEIVYARHAMAEGTAIDYWKLIIEQRDKIMAVLKETDWVEAKNKSGIKVSYRQTEKGKIFHLEVELDTSPANAKGYVTPRPKGFREKVFKKHSIKNSL